MTTETACAPDCYTTLIREHFADHDASRMELKPFMPLQHYQQHFDFQLYADWPQPDYARMTWELHYWLFEL